MMQVLGKSKISKIEIAEDGDITFFFGSSQPYSSKEFQNDGPFGLRRYLEEIEANINDYNETDTKLYGDPVGTYDESGHIAQMD